MLLTTQKDTSQALQWWDYSRQLGKWRRWVVERNVEEKELELIHILDPKFKPGLQLRQYLGAIMSILEYVEQSSVRHLAPFMYRPRRFQHPGLKISFYPPKRERFREHCQCSGTKYNFVMPCPSLEQRAWGEEGVWGWGGGFQCSIPHDTGMNNNGASEGTVHCKVFPI